MNPKYLYVRTVLIVCCPYTNFRLSSLPVLLKIIHFVLSVFIVKPLFSAYVSNSPNMLLRPVSVSDSIKRSSAQIMQLMCFPSDIFIGEFDSLFKTFGRSDKKILSNSGLNIQPCLILPHSLYILCRLSYMFCRVL